MPAKYVLDWIHQIFITNFEIESEPSKDNIREFRHIVAGRIGYLIKEGVLERENK